MVFGQDEPFPPEPTRDETGNLAYPPSVDLSMLGAGTVVELTTRNSTYWLTITAGGSLKNGRWTGVSLTTNSANFGSVTKSPLEQNVACVAQVGQPFTIGSGAMTSAIKHIRVH